MGGIFMINVNIIRITRITICIIVIIISSEGALYVILPYDYQAAAAAATF